MRPAFLEEWTRSAGLLARLWRRRPSGGPTRVTAILTERCHLRCDFCRLWEAPHPGAPLSEWSTVFRSNPGLRWVNLSGGELFALDRLGPFLEQLVGDLPHLALLDFPTAGQRPAEVEKTVRQLLATRLPRLVVSVSLDGGPALHDELRGVPGAFERALETYLLLRPLRSRRFQVRLGCTLTERAKAQAAGLESELRRRIPDFRRDEVHFNLAHHSSHYYRNAEFTSWPGREALEVLESGRRGLTPVGWVEWIYQSCARRALRDNFPPMGCEALRHTVFIASDLTVHPCSIWNRPLGNLRDVGHDLTRLFQDLRAREARTLIERRQCPGCFTPCEAVPAILAHPLRSTWLGLRNGR